MEELNSDLILEIAWYSIEKFVKEETEWLPDLNEQTQHWLHKKMGVFTTVYSHKKGKKQLRGCIGLPYPDEKLGHAIAISARRSVSEDPRFPRVVSEELMHLKISVEVLSPIEEIKFVTSNDLLEKIELGLHGLLIDWKNFAGLLLPRVPIEMKWSKEQYLKNIVKKANLREELLYHPDTKLYRFTSKQFLQN